MSPTSRAFTYLFVHSTKLYSIISMYQHCIRQWIWNNEHAQNSPHFHPQEAHTLVEYKSDKRKVILVMVVMLNIWPHVSWNVLHHVNVELWGKRQPAWENPPGPWVWWYGRASDPLSLNERGLPVHLPLSLVYLSLQLLWFFWPH